MKILLVDDALANIMLLEELLQGKHETATAFNGQEALEKIYSFDPDLVLLDIMMPVLDGISTLKRIRENFLYVKLPVIIVTAKHDYNDIREAIHAGASDYIKKPIDITELFIKIKIQERLITKHKELQEQFFYANIQESLTIAQRFQQSLLPDKQKRESMFAESFVLNMPKDVVSGDFYYFYNLPNRKIITLFDCIGHGVPAAMMSVAAHLITSRYINDNTFFSLPQIVQLIIRDFFLYINQSNDTYSYFSLDAIFLEIIESEMVVNFLGAHRPLFILRADSKTTELLVDDSFLAAYLTVGNKTMFKIPGNIEGISLQEVDYRCSRIHLQKGDILYLFSDGYTEHLSSDFSKIRISLKGFAQMLLENHHLSMSAQKQLLYEYFNNNLKGNQQLDDIVVIGIKV